MSERAFKERVRRFYDVLSPHFQVLWGDHLHDGLYVSGDEAKQVAQENLVQYLARESEIAPGSKGLDVGCGMGASSISLARDFGCEMTGITLSPVQVEMAEKLAVEKGVEARFLVMDADSIQLGQVFDFVWMLGVLGHLRDQSAFIASSPRLLRSGGRFVLADWMTAPDLTPRDRRKYVDPVLRGMLMPQIFPLIQYVQCFEESGYRVLFAKDISDQTRKTWDEAVSVIQVPAVYRLAKALGRDALQLLRAIWAMKRAMAVSKIVYGVVIAERP